MLCRFALVDFPAERSEVIRSLDVPLAEIRRAVAVRTQPLRPVWLVSAQHALIRVAPVLHLQHPVIVRQQPRHQTGPRGRTGRRGGVRAVERQRMRAEFIKHRRDARAVRFQRTGLQAVH